MLNQSRGKQIILILIISTIVGSFIFSGILYAGEGGKKSKSSNVYYEKLGELLAIIMSEVDPPPKGCPQDTMTIDSSELPPDQSSQNALSMVDSEPPPKSDPQDTMSVESNLLVKNVSMQEYVETMKKSQTKSAESNVQLDQIKKYDIPNSKYAVEIVLVKDVIKNSSSFVVTLRCKNCVKK